MKGLLTARDSQAQQYTRFRNNDNNTTNVTATALPKHDWDIPTGAQTPRLRRLPGRVEGIPRTQEMETHCPYAREARPQGLHPTVLPILAKIYEDKQVQASHSQRTKTMARAKRVDDPLQPLQQLFLTLSRRETLIDKKTGETPRGFDLFWTYINITSYIKTRHPIFFFPL